MLFKTLTRYLPAALCLVCLAGSGQVGAVETISYNWELTQDVSMSSIDGVSVRQAVSGWGLVEQGVTRSTVSLWDSFKGFTGTACVSQAAGNLNNVFSLVWANQGSEPGAIATKVPVFIQSVIADNVVLNIGDTAYKAVIGGGSFGSSRGIVAATQVSGNMNNITNIVGFNTKDTPALALSNATLSDVKASDNVYQNYGKTQASVEIQADSFKGFNGVANVVQAAGNMIQIHSQVSVKINQ
jgi:hypothetical protein